MARDCVIEILSESKEKKATLDESFLKGLSESMEKFKIATRDPRKSCVVQRKC